MVKFNLLIYYIINIILKFKSKTLNPQFLPFKLNTLRTQVETIKMTKEIELPHLNTLICLFSGWTFGYYLTQVHFSQLVHLVWKNKNLQTIKMVNKNSIITS
jgi:hypothetical protein